MGWLSLGEDGPGGADSSSWYHGEGGGQKERAKATGGIRWTKPERFRWCTRKRIQGGRGCGLPWWLCQLCSGGFQPHGTPAHHCCSPSAPTASLCHDAALTSAWGHPESAENSWHIAVVQGCFGALLVLSEILRQYTIRFSLHAEKEMLIPFG